MKFRVALLASEEATVLLFQKTRWFFEFAIAIQRVGFFPSVWFLLFVLSGTHSFISGEVSPSQIVSQGSWAFMTTQQGTSAFCTSMHDVQLLIDSTER